MTRTVVLSDEMWARIEPVLPPVKGAMGRPMRGHRLLVEDAIHRCRTGLAWRDLPAEFGPWQTVWKRHHRFATDGTWDRVLCALQVQADAQGKVDWRLSVDSMSAQVRQHAASAARCSGEVTSHKGGRSNDKSSRCCRDEPGDPAIGRSRGV
jgi:transposase